MRRKVAGLLFFLCLIAPLVATFSVLQYQKRVVRKAVKHQMIVGIDRDDLVRLAFTKEEQESELDWEHSREFEYREQMYDVVATRQVGDTTYYWCWWDHEETELNKRLAELVKGILTKDPLKKDQQNKLAEFFLKLYFVKNADFTAFTRKETGRFYFVQSSYDAIDEAPPAPPPQMS